MTNVPVRRTVGMRIGSFVTAVMAVVIDHTANPQRKMVSPGRRHWVSDRTASSSARMTARSDRFRNRMGLGRGLRLVAAWAILHLRLAGLPAKMIKPQTRCCLPD